ncbi:MAG: glycosyltransferase family 2 protein [Chloroflexi bacterium]|nr:MAG: glycosyltransferase family 2 protein [Chloroflexota bacterium]
MTTLSVVIPALNEEDGIAEIIERVLAVRPALAEVGVEDLELIVVDDGSRDRTAEIAAGYAEVRLIRHPVNRGYGAAIKTGFRAARGELLAFLDADGTYPPERFPALCKPALDGADVVVGSRMAGTESDMPLVRRIGNIIFATLVSLVSNVRITDSASGQRVLRREALPILYPLPDGLNFTPVMTTRALHENLKIVEVPIPYAERRGRSKLSVVKDGWRFLSTIVGTAFTYNPVRILGAAGGALVLVALLLAIPALMALVRGTRSEVPAIAVFAGTVLTVVGVTLFSTGALFNYIVSLFHHRPIRQGLFGRPLFRTPLERHFGWMGMGAIVGGVLLYGVTKVAGLAPTPWFYPVVSAMMVVMGVQLVTSWMLVVVLAELNERESRALDDLNGQEAREAAPVGGEVIPAAG